MIAVVGIGSNLGSRYALVRAAVQWMRARFGGARCSPFYLSPALALPGVEAGPDFVNAAVRITTELSLPELLAELQAVEDHFGRERRRRWADRTLDLDILWATESCDEPQVPHPECVRRLFALAPLLDVAGELVPADFRAALAQLGGPLTRCPEPVVRSAPGRVSVRGALDSNDALALAAGHTSAPSHGAARHDAAHHDAAHHDAAHHDAAHHDAAHHDLVPIDSQLDPRSPADSLLPADTFFEDWRRGSMLCEGDEFSASEATVFFADGRLFLGSGAPWRVARLGPDSADVDRVDTR